MSNNDFFPPSNQQDEVEGLQVEEAEPVWTPDKIGQSVVLTTFLVGFALEIHLVIILVLLRWLTPWL